MLVETPNGLIPTHRIIRVIDHGSKKSQEIEYDAGNGHTKRTTSPYPVTDFDFAPVVAAEPGHWLVELFGGDEPLFTPVLAWQIIAGQAVPITNAPASLPENRHAVLGPDGWVRDTHGGLFRSVDDYVASERERKAKDAPSCP